MNRGLKALIFTVLHGDEMANLAPPQNETTPNLEINASYTRQDWESFQPIPAKKLSPRNRSHPKALALWKAVAKWQCLAHTTDISQIAFKSMAIITKLRRRCNGFPSASRYQGWVNASGFGEGHTPSQGHHGHHQCLNRHSPDSHRVCGNHTTVPPSREWDHFGRHPMT